MGQQLTVDAKAKWNHTNITMVAGDHFRIVVKGGSWSCNLEGQKATYTGVGWTQGPKAKEGYAMPNVPEGALVARVGKADAKDGPVFLVGDDGTVALGPHDKSGELLLTCNDDLDKKYGNGYDDNTGSLSVDISGPFDAQGRALNRGAHHAVAGNP